MMNLELLPLPVCRIAFVNLLYNKLRFASPNCMMNLELLPLPVCRNAFVNILYNKLRFASPAYKSCFPYLFVELHL